MSDRPDSVSDKGVGRRRLLRGSVAVPAVMTLVSGSALATSSLTCAQKLNLDPKTAGTSPSGSVWIRVPVWQKRVSSSRFALFVSGSDIASLLPPGGSYLSTGQWQCFQITGTSFGYSAGAIYTTSQATAISSLTMSKVTGAFVAVRVDGTGKVVGVEPHSSAHSAMSTSCWTSFGAANPFKLG